MTSDGTPSKDFAAITAGIAFATAAICAVLGMFAPAPALMSAALIMGGAWLLDDKT